MPEISVIMSTYNGSKSLSAAINSLLKQTFDDFELIICDDASSDNSLEIIENLAKKDKRIKVITNSKNLGLANSLNNCLEIATGPYIARMDDDDISHPQRLERQIMFMKENPRYAIVGTSVRYFDENGVWGKKIRSGERTLVDIYCGKTFTHPSVLMRREALDKVDNYTVSHLTIRGQDYDLWCKLYYEGFVGYNMSEILLDYYESKSSIKRRKFRYRVHGCKVRLYWRKKFGLPKWYDLFAYKEVIAGAVPNTMLFYRRKLVNKVMSE